MGDNEVLLRGRVVEGPAERVLADGEVVTVRVDVPRAGPGRGSDWVECVVRVPRCRRQVLGWGVGDRVELRGELRRRYFRASGRTVTTLDVEVRTGRRLRRAA